MATVIALMVVAIAFVLALSAGDSAARVANLSLAETLNEKARLGAEAGINNAISQLRGASSWSAGFSNQPLPVSGVTYSVTVKNNASGSAAVTATDGTSVPAGTVYLISTSTVSNTTRTVSALLKTSGDSPFNYAIFGASSTTDLTLSNGASIDSYDSSSGKSGSDALVGGNGNVTISGGAKIDGSAVSGPAPSTVSVANGGSVAGTTSSAAAVINWPTVNAAYTTPNANTTGLSGGSLDATTHNLTVSGTATLSGGTYYFNDVTVSNGGSLNVTGASVIYVTGTIKVDNGGRLNNSTKIPSNLQIYSSYDGTTGVQLAGGSDTYGTIYAPKTGFVLDNGGDIYGSIVSSTVSLAGGSKIHYDTALKSVTSAVDTSSGITVLSWDRH